MNCLKIKWINTLGKDSSCLLKLFLTFFLISFFSVTGAIASEIQENKQVEKNYEKELKGIVTLEDGEPLIGVSVMVKGTSYGTITDINGKYKLNIKTKSAVIVFSYIGMETKEVKYNGQANLNVILKDDAELLDEVIVTGYQTISKERATGSFDIINKEQLEKPASNIASRLIGTTSGVQTKTDSDGNIIFEIRGQSRLSDNSAENQPLVVVDGFPIQGDFNSINPNDVASVTILKDAAAASIWGAKSANGVIVVTTKSGQNKEKGTKVDFSLFWKVSPKLDYSYLNPIASSADVIDYEKIAFSTNMFGGPWPLIPDSPNKIADNYSKAMTAMNENRLGYLTDAELQSTLAQLASQNNAQQIKDLLMENPFTQQYNINISNKGNKSNNMLSLMYEGSKGNWKGISKDRYNLSYRTNVAIAKWMDFSLAANVNYQNKKNNDCSTESPYAMYGYPNENYPQEWSPYEMILDANGQRTSMDKYYMPNIKRYLPMENFTYQNWGYNPLDEMDAKNFRNTQINSRINAGLNLKLMEGLSFDTKIQYEQLYSSSKNILTDQSYTVRKEINTSSTWDRATNRVTANLPKGGFMDESKTTMNYYNWRNQLNYRHSFDDEKHVVNFVAGSEISDNVYQTTVYARVYGYDNDKLSVGIFPNGTTVKNMNGSNKTFSYTNKYTYSTQRYFSCYANLAYTLNRKYTFSGSYRTDASNMITDDPKYRYSPFWSVGASWNLSSEKFMQPAESWLDRLIVRLTYGANGNVDTSTSFKPLISMNSQQNIYINDFTAKVSSYGNPTLRWEKTYNLDLGIDYSVMKGKLYGKVDFYNKKGTDLIVSMSIPSANGTSMQKMNAAEMINRGIEMELGSKLKIRGNDITWRGGLNFSYNYNNISKLFKTNYMYYELTGGGSSSYVQNCNANTLWAFQYRGVKNIGSESNPHYSPMIQGIGDNLYNISLMSTANATEYMKNMGTTVAPYLLGFNSSFKIYDFDLSFIFTGKFGHKFMATTFNYPSTGLLLPNKLYMEYKNADPMKRVPIPVNGNESRYYFWGRYYPYMDYNVQSANHIRCQEISLSYTLPYSVLKVIGLKEVRLNLQGNNLFTITNNRYNEDPEYLMGSIKPQPSYTFGINIKL